MKRVHSAMLLLFSCLVLVHLEPVISFVPSRITNFQKQNLHSMPHLVTRNQRDLFGLYATASNKNQSAETSTSSLLRNNASVVKSNDNRKDDQARLNYKHTLVILSMPRSSLDRIANEAILEKALENSSKLSVVLRCQGPTPTLASLRRYVGEVYSMLWDVCVSTDFVNKKQLQQAQQQTLTATASGVDTTAFSQLPSVVVYPQNLPNTAPEAWLNIQADLDCVCTCTAMLGWMTESSSGRGKKWEQQSGDGVGGLQEHVQALNAERKERKLKPVQALPVAQTWTKARTEYNGQVLFLDDEEHEQNLSAFRGSNGEKLKTDIDNNNDVDDEFPNDLMLAGARPSGRLFDSVAVGGTFDGLHFGHCKLLTLAVSSVRPISGKLLVGVTVDEMLKRKQFAEYIPDWKTRAQGVREFLDRLAPGMKDRVRVVPINDAFGPPGRAEEHFDALVLSHETLETGYLLNQHRKTMGLEPLQLLCTRRTEAYGMSSTTLRRMRSQQQQLNEKQ